MKKCCFSGLLHFIVQIVWPEIRILWNWVVNIIWCVKFIYLNGGEMLFSEITFFFKLIVRTISFSKFTWFHTEHWFALYVSVSRSNFEAIKHLKCGWCFNFLLGRLKHSESFLPDQRLVETHYHIYSETKLSLYCSYKPSPKICSMQNCWSQFSGFTVVIYLMYSPPPCSRLSEFGWHFLWSVIHSLHIASSSWIPLRLI